MWPSLWAFLKILLIRDFHIGIAAFLLNLIAFHASLFLDRPPIVTDKWTCGFHLRSCPKVWIAVNMPTVMPLFLASFWMTSAAALAYSFSRSLWDSKNPQYSEGIVKVMCCHSQSGRVAFCFWIQISVAFLPHVEQNLLLQLKVTYWIWSQSVFEQQYFLYPLIILPQLRSLIIFLITATRI